jgi:hypothetical protein
MNTWKTRLLALTLAAGAGYASYSINDNGGEFKVALTFGLAAVALLLVVVWPSERKRWTRRSHRDDAAHMSGQITERQYWARVHRRDRKLRGMSPSRRQRINRGSDKG